MAANSAKDRRQAAGRMVHRDTVRKELERGERTTPCRCQVCTYHVTEQDRQFLGAIGVKVD